MVSFVVPKPKPKPKRVLIIVVFIRPLSVPFLICTSAGSTSFPRVDMGLAGKGPVVVVHGGAWAVPDSLEVFFTTTVANATTSCGTKTTP